MKIAIWVKSEIEVPDDVLRECHEESCRVFETDATSFEDLLWRAEGQGDIELPDSWGCEPEFDRVVTRAELEEEIQGQ